MKKEFFAGASTPKGFFTYLPEALPDIQTGFRFDIKGSSGSGKSTMLKRIATVMREHKIETEYLHCASDPASLDGLIFPAQHIAITDSTAPHAMDPSLPGVSGCVIDLYAFLDNDKLTRFRPILTEAYFKKQELYQKAFSYLAAASCLLPKETLDRKETESVATQIYKEYLAKASPGKAPTRKMFLFAVTPDGIASYPEGLPKKKLILKGSGAPYVIESLARRADAGGIGYDLGFSPLSPTEKPLHIIFPTLKIAILAESPWFTAEGEALLLSRPAPKQTKDIHQLMDKSITNMKKAREWHKKIESVYATAMDFSKVEAKGAQVTEMLLDLCKATRK